MKLDDLIKLRGELRAAYKLSTDDDLDISNTKSNEYYEELRIAVKKELGAKTYVPEAETLRKLFYDDDYLEIKPNTLKPLKDFIRICTQKYKHKSFLENILVNEFDGGYAVDNEFIQNISELNQHSSPNEFYLSKNNDGCQWYGIIKTWDIRRTEYSDVKGIALKLFEKKYISGLILGASGSGKSTLLRRLAKDLICDEFKIIWITNLLGFHRSIDTLIKSKEKFLLIIEDWEKVKADSIVNKFFLNRVINSEHLRLLIGDTSSVGKEYLEFIDDNFTVTLTASENKSIVKKIVKINKRWIAPSKKILSDPQIFHCPLYMILFVLAYHTQETANNEYGENGIKGQFQKIIIHDQKRIHETYPGLALAIYYWACIRKESPFCLFWDNFLKIADYYSKSTVLSERFQQIDLTDPIGQILSHYFSFRYFELKYRSGWVLSFHHDLLASEGLSIPIYSSWPVYNESIFNEIIEKVYPAEIDGKSKLFLVC